MIRTKYPPEVLGTDQDDGTMPRNVATLGESVVGHRIVAAGKRDGGFTIVLDDGTDVILRDTQDCCAYTELAGFFLDPTAVDHIITGVGTTDGYETWHIYADWGDILKLKVNWSCGNPFYYGYGFSIQVIQP